LDDNDCSALSQLRQSTLKDNIYLKIVGKLAPYEGKQQIIANSVRPLSTGNELTHHMLQCMYSSEKYKRADSIVPPTSVGGVGFGAPIQEQMTGKPAGDDPIQQSILEYIRNEGESAEYGADIKGLFAQLPQYPEAQIRQVVENLGSEGQIYSTVDEDHYKYAM
jgi:replication factor A2